MEEEEAACRSVIGEAVTIGHGSKGRGLTVFLIGFDLCKTGQSRPSLRADTVRF